TYSTNWGRIMTIGSVTPSDQAITEVLAPNDVRTLVAKHLGVSVARVTDEAHFTDDLGADWLDRLELMMVVEDQFAGVEITDKDVDRIEVVGDLIRHVELVNNERLRRGAVRDPPPSRSTEKSWPHFRPPAVDFCGSRLAIGAATERARALAMPAGTRA